MKELIKKILREQDIDLNRDPDAQETHAQEVQDLESPDEVGGWRNPIRDDSPGNVPPNSYIGQKYNYETKRYYKPTIAKNIFFKATQILCRMKDASWFADNEDYGDNLYQRQKDMSTPLKVLGIESEEGLADKIFWAGNDNIEGIVDGSITSYDQLYLRPLIEYSVPLYESVREYKTISWTPKTECYSKDDALNTVIYDEDDVYSSYEWDNDPSYSEDSDEWEGEGKELDGEVQVVKVIYPAEEGGEIVKESINEEMGPGPEENDIISELEETLSNWEACEEGMPIACRYKNDVQEIIDRYKSKTLYEHKLIEEKEFGFKDSVDEIAAKLMGVLVKKLGKDRIKEMEKDSPALLWNEIIPYSKIFGLSDNTHLEPYHKQLIQFMVNKGIPEDYTEFIGEQLPVLHEYSFEKTFIKSEEAVYSGSIYLEDTNYGSARCEAQNNFWEHDPDEEYVEQQDSEFVGDEEWYSVHKDGEMIWSDGNVKDQKYNPDEGC